MQRGIFSLLGFLGFFHYVQSLCNAFTLKFLCDVEVLVKGNNLTC